MLSQQLHLVDFWLHPISQTQVWSYGDIANTNTVRVPLVRKKGRLEHVQALRQSLR